MYILILTIWFGGNAVITTAEYEGLGSCYLAGKMAKAEWGSPTHEVSYICTAKRY